MRMRLRTNARERVEECGKWYISADDDRKNYQEVAQERELIDYETLFGKNAPTYLEVGCGMGGFICAQAVAHPNNNYLGVEKISNVMLTGLEKAVAENIENVRFMRAKAEWLTKYIPEKSISGIYLNFSTPLPKKGYASQRLTAPRFLQIYKQLLCENGFIIQKTDDEDFFNFSVECFENCGFTIVEKSDNLHAKGVVGIVTEYERKFIEKGKPIHYLKAVIKD